MITFEITQVDDSKISSFIDHKKTEASWNEICFGDDYLTIQACDKLGGNLCSINFVVDEDFLRELKLLVTVIEKSWFSD